MNQQINKSASLVTLFQCDAVEPYETTENKNVLKLRSFSDMHKFHL